MDIRWTIVVINIICIWEVQIFPLHCLLLDLNHMLCETFDLYLFETIPFKFERRAIQNTSFMSATPQRNILWCLMVMTFTSRPAGGRWTLWTITRDPSLTGDFIEYEYCENILYCFIPFKLGSNPQHLSQWLSYNILLFSASGGIWINK